MVARLTPARAKSPVPRADVLDQFLVSYAFSDACARHKKLAVSVSVFGRQGYLDGFFGGGPIYRPLFSSLPAATMRSYLR